MAGCFASELDISALEIKEIENNHTEYLYNLNKRITKLEDSPSIDARISAADVLSKLRILEGRTYKLENFKPDVLLDFEKRINKLEDYMTIEDRVTCSNVLIRLTHLENSYNKLQEHHVRQVDENRKVGRILDEFEEYKERVDMMCSEKLVKGVEEYVKMNVNLLWKKVNELESVVKDIESKLKFITALPIELDIRLKYVEGILDKCTDKINKKPYRCPV